MSPDTEKPTTTTCDATDGSCKCTRKAGHDGSHLCACDRMWRSQ